MRGCTQSGRRHGQALRPGELAQALRQHIWSKRVCNHVKSWADRSRASQRPQILPEWAAVTLPRSRQARCICTQSACDGLQVTLKNRRGHDYILFVNPEGLASIPAVSAPCCEVSSCLLADVFDSPKGISQAKWKHADTAPAVHLPLCVSEGAARGVTQEGCAGLARTLLLPPKANSRKSMKSWSGTMSEHGPHQNLWQLGAGSRWHVSGSAMRPSMGEHTRSKRLQVL